MHQFPLPQEAKFQKSCKGFTSQTHHFPCQNWPGIIIRSKCKMREGDKQHKLTNATAQEIKAKNQGRWFHDIYNKGMIFHKVINFCPFLAEKYIINLHLEHLRDQTAAFFHSLSPLVIQQSISMSCLTLMVTCIFWRSFPHGELDINMHSANSISGNYESTYLSRNMGKMHFRSYRRYLMQWDYRKG